MNLESKNLEEWVECIAQNATKQKGVYTVLITLLVHKIYDPEQDIRKHQANSMSNGFSGRSIDTREITPTLKKIGLPAMSESGWLTRSLEQPYPYTLDYNGKIGGKNVKTSFLNILDSVENNSVDPKNILIKLLGIVSDVAKSNQIEIVKIKDSDNITITEIIDFLSEQFFTPYKTHGGSKLPVIAIHSILTLLIKELSRYKNCELNDLGSHTASDRTSKTSGDIEIFKNGKLFESIEIKLDKPIDTHLLRNIKDKIYKHNPTRYYILSCVPIKNNQEEKLQKIIASVKSEHGCQIIINGVIDTIKYYLRLINKCNSFMDIYLKRIEIDNELQLEHKEILNLLVCKHFK